MKKITWRGVEYLSREIEIEDNGTTNPVTIASTRLGSVLENEIEAGSLEALRFDETIAFFVDDEIFELSEEDFVKYVENNY